MVRVLQTGSPLLCLLSSSQFYDASSKPFIFSTQGSNRLQNNVSSRRGCGDAGMSTCADGCVLSRNSEVTSTTNSMHVQSLYEQLYDLYQEAVHAHIEACTARPLASCYLRACQKPTTGKHNWSSELTSGKPKGTKAVPTISKTSCCGTTLDEPA